MTTSLRSRVSGLPALLLAACVASPSGVSSRACQGQSDLNLLPMEAAGLSLMLPAGSKLERLNTEDARYWIWETPQGQLSITWIGEIARESILEGMSPSTCRLAARDAQFTTEWKQDRLIAVSDALLDNGAGVVVRLKPISAKADHGAIEKILRSLTLGKTGTE